MIQASTVSELPRISLPIELAARWPAERSIPGFRDAVWDLSPLLPPSQRRDQGVVRFDPTEDPDVSFALRDFLHVRLNCAVLPHRHRLLPLNLRATYYHARRCFRFIKAETGAVDLKCINQLHLDRFLKKLLEEGRPPLTIHSLLVIFQDLHLFRGELAAGGLSFFPWSSRSVQSVAGSSRKRRENRTGRIPESIVEQLLFWALRYVEDYSNDILAARDEFLELERNSHEILAADMLLSPADRAKERYDRIQAFIDRCRKSGRGLPVCTIDDGRNHSRQGRPNYNLLCLILGDPNRTWLKSERISEAFNRALLELGPEEGGLNVSCRIDETLGRPWKSGFNESAVVRECRLLQTACYIVCAYLTGMRDCEVQSMRTGCLSIGRSEDGVIERYLIAAELGKSTTSTRPRAKWVAIEPVACAVRILERLHERTGDGNLWRIVEGLQVEAGYETISYGINRYLNIFASHLEQVFGAELAEPNTTRWRLTSRQFRRTMAWHIARRPFGLVAGKIQYQHASVAAFEGYAGTSASGFRAEVEAEIAIGQLDGLLEYYSGHTGGQRLLGPGAPRVKALLTEVGASAGELPGLVADTARIRTLLKSPARMLHIGLLSDCFFDPDRALCLRGARAGKQKPIAALCAPTKCVNSCIGEHHLKAWQSAAEHARDALKLRGLSKAQREVIESDLDVIDSILIEAEIE